MQKLQHLVLQTYKATMERGQLSAKSWVKRASPWFKTAPQWIILPSGWLAEITDELVIPACDFVDVRKQLKNNSDKCHAHVKMCK